MPWTRPPDVLCQGSVRLKDPLQGLVKPLQGLGRVFGFVEGRSWVSLRGEVWRLQASFEVLNFLDTPPRRAVPRLC